MLDEMLGYVHELYPLVYGKLINPDEIIFEERIKMNCFYCGRYGNNWRCPPHVPDVDYKKYCGNIKIVHLYMLICHWERMTII